MDIFIPDIFFQTKANANLVMYESLSEETKNNY